MFRSSKQSKNYNTRQRQPSTARLFITNHLSGKSSQIIKLSIYLFLILSAAANSFAQAEQLEFSDNSHLTLLSNGTATLNDFSDTGKIVRKEAIAVLTGMGKSPSQFTFGQFSVQTNTGKLTKLTKKQRISILNKVDKVNTAYGFKQGETEFYINGFNLINFRSLYDCRECKIKISLVILEFKADGKFYYSPFIESIKKLSVIKQQSANSEP